MLQLNPPIPVIAKGRKGLAHVLIDYGAEFDLLWVVFLDNGECWCVPNPDVRAQDNWTFKRFVGGRDARSASKSCPDRVPGQGDGGG